MGVCHAAHRHLQSAPCPPSLKSATGLRTRDRKNDPYPGVGLATRNPSRAPSSRGNIPRLLSSTTCFRHPHVCRCCRRPWISSLVFCKASSQPKSSAAAADHTPDTRWRRETGGLNIPPSAPARDEGETDTPRSVAAARHSAFTITAQKASTCGKALSLLLTHPPPTEGRSCGRHQQQDHGSAAGGPGKGGPRGFKPAAISQAAVSHYNQPAHPVGIGAEIEEGAVVERGPGAMDGNGERLL